MTKNYAKLLSRQRVVSGKRFQRVPSGKRFRCIGGINLMILTQAILKIMFVYCHMTDSLKMPPTKNMAVSPRFGEISLFEF